MNEIKEYNKDIQKKNNYDYNKDIHWMNYYKRMNSRFEFKIFICQSWKGLQIRINTKIWGYSI